ncbi:MAG TPA: hypothetical protein VF773_05500 [Verrucomicrobiae bacterium]
MTPYLDAGFLITLLVKTNGTSVANETLPKVEMPCRITRFHELQAKTFLVQYLFSGDSVKQGAAENGLNLWNWYVSQGIFEMVDVEWSTVFESVTKFVEESNEPPPAPLLVLHPILAAYSGASDFLSFDPRSRGIARALGLKVLPEKI